MLALTLESDAEFQPREVYQQMKDKLPAYAIPLFIRLQEEQETTSTFKTKKNELKREGYSFSGAQIYILRDRELGYEQLTSELRADIDQGAIRF
ncbi:long-chain-acyl-CoA synthetase [compost metagenome]